MSACKEPEERSLATATAIKTVYDNPSTLEQRVDSRIQAVLAILQNTAQNQARSTAETQVVDQAAARYANASIQGVLERAAAQAQQQASKLLQPIAGQQKQVKEEVGATRKELQLLREEADNRTLQLQLIEERARSVAMADLNKCTLKRTQQTEEKENAIAIFLGMAAQ
ncbi:hypothetical protein BBJ28_00018596 [Nothophytophthora sp. Chile5]|nr:hypothetical protein BBJ28_00018596 [Nothophytophthora sp. Chile5]